MSFFTSSLALQVREEEEYLSFALWMQGKLSAAEGGKVRVSGHQRHYSQNETCLTLLL